MFQAEIHHDTRASTPSGLLLARGSLTITSFHYFNLMFQSKQQQKKNPTTPTNSIFQKQEGEKPQLMSIKYGQNSFPNVCFDKTTISS